MRHFSRHLEPFAFVVDHVAGLQLPPPPGLDLAADPDRAALNQCLHLAAGTPWETPGGRS